MHGFKLDRLCTTAQEFFDAIVATHQRSDFGEFFEVGRAGAVFRGVDNADLPNKARAFRPDGNPTDYQPYAIADAPADKDARTLRNYLWDHRMREMHAVFKFLDYADRLGIPSPLDFHSLNLEFQETLILTSDKKWVWTERAPKLDHPFPSANVREAFAMAQHYGVPTRLLDWTESPLIAMFFACGHVWKNILRCSIKEAQSKIDSIEAKEVVVYAVGRLLLQAIGAELVRVTRFQNPFLRAQQGVFTLDTKADTFFLEHGYWPSFDDRISYLEQETKDGLYLTNHPVSAFIKYRLPASEARKLALILLHHGVSYETVFPSLDAAALAFKYTKLVAPEETTT